MIISWIKLSPLNPARFGSAPKLLPLYFIYVLSRLAGWDKVPLFVPPLNVQAQTCFCI